MFFGLPWWALIPIIAVAGGLFIEYRKQELKAEEKRMTSSREIHELRKVIHGLKNRVEKLEMNASASNKKQRSSSLGDIEIDEQQDNDGASSGRNRINN